MNNDIDNKTTPDEKIKSDSQSDESADFDKSRVDPGSAPGPDTINGQPSLLVRFWRGLIARQIFQKLISLLFALMVFSVVYERTSQHRSILSYLGNMLLMVLIYAEVLVVRDHLWVIEGSMRESRRWRDIFFNQASLRRQKFRKLFLVLFAMGIFSYVHHYALGPDRQILSFMGIILMMTMLYYEVLSLRDEVFVMSQAIVDRSNEKDLHSEKNRDEFEKIISVISNGTCQTGADTPERTSDQNIDDNKGNNETPNAELVDKSRDSQDTIRND